MQPPPPAQTTIDRARPTLLPAGATRRPTAGVGRAQRALMLGGAFAAAALGVGVAPYLTFWTLAALALAVRTLSWTTESARERQHARGRRRWYDAPLTVLSSPWYLVVATGGTLMLLAWAALLTLLAGLSYGLFGLPVRPGLVLLGAVLAAGLWTGPGSKRLRLPARRLVVSLTHDMWVGWTFVAAVGIVVAVLGWAFATGDPTWAPQPGPPWREGTLLGGLVGWL
jgi:hypothetical protein